jgi:signal transduction histidine kinase
MYFIVEMFFQIIYIHNGINMSDNKHATMCEPKRIPMLDPANLKESLARELHDDLSQYITTISMYISGIQSSNKIQTTHQFADAMKSITFEMRNNLKLLLTSLRSINDSSCYTLHAYKHNINDLINKWHALNPSIVLSTSITIPDHFDINCLSHCYQIISEALTNITRHANAKNVSVRTCLDNGTFKLKIIDDGIGFNLEHTKLTNFGLLGMTERAYIMGALINIHSKRFHGTSIEVSLPLNEVEHE